jgi:myosin heavy chain 6/7
MHELDKARRKLEVEKEELQSALEEAEAALEQEENKVLRAQLEMSQVRQEIDRRIQEKEEEFEHSRKNHHRALDSMQASLEAESRAKEEALRIKKKYESDINEMEIALDHANKANNEAKKAIKRTHIQLSDVCAAIEEERKISNEIKEQLGLTERKGNAMSGEMEESKALLEAAIRGQRQVEQELIDTRDQLTDMSASNTSLTNVKRKLENDIHQMQADLDNLLAASKNGEEKAKKAMVDAGRLADELRAEQDHTQAQEKAIRTTEVTMSELKRKAEEAAIHAARSAAVTPAKLEAKGQEIEFELNRTIQKTAEVHKGNTTGERTVKELLFQQEENNKNQDRITDLVEKLQQKIKSYKKQIEEAEEIAAINLAKFRKAQQDLEEAEERSRMAENSVSKYQQARGMSCTPCGDA